MKRFLLSLGLLSVAASAVMAETYDYPTTPMPEAAVWTPVTAAPGVYSSLVGPYECNVSGIYYQIGNTMQLLNYSNAINGYVVNEKNEIVYSGIVKPNAIGMRNMNQFHMTIAEEDAITEPGTYYFIWPTGIDKETANQALLASDGSSVDIYNLKSGPYIVGEIGEPVAADVNVTPAGVFEQPEEGVSKVTLTVTNAWMLNISDIETSIKVTGPDGALTMENAVKNGNTISWEFPVAEDGINTAMLPGGEYTITIGYSNISGYTEALNPLTFPADSTEYTFTIEGEDAGIIPDVTLFPAALEYEEWTSKTIGITLRGYRFAGTGSELAANVPVMVIVDPDGETYTPTGLPRGLNAIGYPVEDIDFSKSGEYNCYWKIGGYKGLNTNTQEEVVFKDMVITYTNLTPEKYAPEVLQLIPAGEAESFTGSALTVQIDGVNIQGLSSTSAPEFEFTKPSGETFTLTTIRKAGYKYSYQVVSPDLFAEEGIYTAVWKLDGWKATIAATAEEPEHEVVLRNVKLLYRIGTETGVLEIDTDGADALYYDLRGRRLDRRPDSGVFIRIEGGRAVKTVQIR